jgi:hypothetical protein
VLCRGHGKSLLERHGRSTARARHCRSTAGARHGRNTAGARHSRSTAGARSVHGKACVNQTRPRVVNQMGKTQSKTLAARHVKGTAWAWHGMCELPFNVPIV